MDTPGLTQFK